MCLSVSAGLKDMMEQILGISEETNSQNALQGAIEQRELNLFFLKSFYVFERFFCLFAFCFYDVSAFKA